MSGRTNKKKPDADAHVQALLLHASLTALSTTRPVSRRYLAGEGLKSGLERALAMIERQMEGM